MAFTTRRRCPRDAHRPTQPRRAPSAHRRRPLRSIAPGELLQVGDHLGAVLRGVHAQVGAGDAPVRRNQEGVALGELEHHPVGICPIGLGHRAPDVGEQGERQAMLLGEGGMGGGVVHAHPHHLGAQGLELDPIVAELAGLLGAARGVVLGIEVQHHPVPAQALQGHRLAGGIGQGEVGRHLAALGRTGRFFRGGNAQGEQDSGDDDNGQQKGFHGRIRAMRNENNMEKEEGLEGKDRRSRHRFPWCRILPRRPGRLQYAPHRPAACPLRSSMDRTSAS